MATIYVSEYQALSNTFLYLSGIVTTQSRTACQAPMEPSVSDQVVAITASSTQSVAFSDQTTFVRINTDAVCSVAIGLNPTATTLSKRLAANQTEYFGVLPGQKIAVIQNV